MADESVKSKLWWAVPAAVMLLFTAVVLLFGQPPEPGQEVSSHSASPRGFRAAYLLLEELGFPVGRTRRPAEGAIRWLLYPNPPRNEGLVLRGWVERGGTLVLADVSTEFAKELGLRLDVNHLGSGDLGFVVADAGPGGEVWLEKDGGPVVTIYRRGAGEIWLVNRPEIVTNKQIGKGDNGLVVVRLAQATLGPDDGRSPILFDEYHHGMRDRPGVLEIMLTPPMHWFTIAALVFLAFLLWQAAPRFGVMRPPVPVRRRSKEEFLDAMAGLLARNRDYEDAYRTARDALIREIEEELGVPAGTPLQQVIKELRGRPRGEALAATLTAHQSTAGTLAFVNALNRLEHARHEFLHGRSHS